MSNLRFVLNLKGLNDLRKSKEMQDVLSRYGAQKAAQAGDGYASATHVFTKRAVCNVYPATKEAAHDNYENNTLEKVITG